MFFINVPIYIIVNATEIATFSLRKAHICKALLDWMCNFKCR